MGIHKKENAWERNGNKLMAFAECMKLAIIEISEALEPERQGKQMLTQYQITHMENLMARDSWWGDDDEEDP